MLACRYKAFYNIYFGMSLTITPIPAFHDNYIWAIMKENVQELRVIDPGDAGPVIAFATEHGLILDDILITHHHHDHIDGIAGLIKTFGDVTITGPNDKRISLITKTVQERDIITIPYLGLIFKVIETPGHTRTHLCFFEPKAKLLFCGDTLFSAGCGRLFEGTPDQMYQSLLKLRSLPKETKIYCAHEYTLNNLQFAKTIEPNNQAVSRQLSQLPPDKITLPSTLTNELKINPFLRINNIELKDAFDKKHSGLTDIERFSLIRRLKDSF